MKLFAFEVFSVCQNWKKQPTLWPGTQGGLRKTPTHTRAHIHCFLLACMKRLFRPAVPLQAQLWSLTLFRENISFTLGCLLIYKKGWVSLKIAWLVWNSGRMKQTLWDTDASENHLYFPFRSCEHLVILSHWCKCRWHLLCDQKNKFHYAVFSSSNQTYNFNRDCIILDM